MRYEAVDVYLFLLIYFLIYASMQWVFYLGIRVLLPHPAVSLGLMLGLALMVLLPVVTHLFDSGQHYFWAGLSAWIGFTWMGYVFLAFWISLLSLTLQALLVLIGLESVTGQVLARPAAVLVLSLPALFMLIGACQSREIRLEEVVIQTTKWARQTSEMRIALISDVHLGLLAGEERVEDMIQLLEKIQPDLILCAGDLVDSRIYGLAQAASALHRVNPPLGKYAVTGNHEMYTGQEASLRFFQSCGFEMLEDQTIRLGNRLNLAGRAYTREKACFQDLSLLNPQPESGFTILLKHDPVICPESLGLFDLQLSGHTHKGQIFPFGLILQLVYPSISGLHELGHGSRLYVSRGTGTWGPQVRLLAPPEMTVIRIRPRLPVSKRSQEGSGQHGHARSQ